MSVFLNPFIKRLFEDRYEASGSPVCYVEFENTPGANEFSSRIALYDVKNVGKSSRVYYRYVDKLYRAEGRMSDWELGDTSYTILNLIRVRQGGRTFPSSSIPLIQVT